MFADDTKMYAPSDDMDVLQNDLYALFDWSKIWQLHFNISKCKVLHVGHSNPHHEYYTCLLYTSDAADD